MKSFETQLAVAWNTVIVYQYMNVTLQFVASGEKNYAFYNNQRYSEKINSH